MLNLNDLFLNWRQRLTLYFDKPVHNLQLSQCWLFFDSLFLSNYQTHFRHSCRWLPTCSTHYAIIPIPCLQSNSITNHCLHLNDLAFYFCIFLNLTKKLFFITFKWIVFIQVLSRSILSSEIKSFPFSKTYNKPRQLDFG